MKIKNVLLSMLAVSAAMLTTSCENGDREFDDFDRQAVYFAYQSPVRTITLGDDVYPTDLDNAHEFEVYATLGGVWKNKQDRKVEIAVDNSLCDGKTFEDGKPIVALPQNYYELESNQAVIEAGEIMGAVKVHLTDAFFNDPKVKEVHYVLPLKIVKADADTVLESKNYTLYAVKYKNKYTGCWLSHGTDEIDNNGKTSTNTREPEDFRKYDLRYLATTALNQCTYALTATVNGKEMTRNIVLTFDDKDNCTLSSADADFEVSGTGKWTRMGAPKAWGDKDRDLLELEYTAKFKNGAAYYKVSTKESLIMRDRQSKFETFNFK